MAIKSIGIVGAGQMGSGIAHVASLTNHEVILQDVSSMACEKSLSIISKNMQKSVEKGKIAEEEKSRALQSIRCVTELDDLRDCDIIIEAATEKWNIKEGIFKNLDRICKPETILASNTSSISINQIAGATARPTQVIGMHFMNPVPIMVLVEVIRGSRTSDQTYSDVILLSKTLGKVPLGCNDSPGFVSNRILLPMINEAVYTLAEGVASIESIDGIMKLGMNHPMGPLTLADFIGLDTCLYILNVIHNGMKQDKYRPCPLLEAYVQAGFLGKKTGKGFYDYSTGEPRPHYLPGRS
ncbi:MAG: 3-hydroxybutyryl-CoA dehydrogenase [Holophagaceae bacterium]